MGSPVTPNTPDNVTQRFDYVYPETDAKQEPAIPDVDVLTDADHSAYLDAQLKVNFDELCKDL